MTTLQRFACALTCLLAASSAACTSWVTDPVEAHVTDPAVERVNEELPSWSGGWEGTWEAPDGTLHPARAQLVQRGLFVEGILELDDQPCVPRASITAEVTGSGLDAQARVGDADVRYSVSYFNGKESSGVLSLVDPARCAAKEGSRAAIRLRR